MNVQSACCHCHLNIRECDTNHAVEKKYASVAFKRQPEQKMIVAFVRFCQMPAPTSERERIQRVKKRARANDPSAIYFLGCLYAAGEDGLPKNFSKAMEFWLRAGDLGCAEAYCHAGAAHFNGLGVERDMKKAKHYYGLAAMGGDAEARHNLGCFEEEMGNMKKAIEHWMIAAQSGFDLSLSAIREAYVNSHVTKDDFEKALRAHDQEGGCSYCVSSNRLFAK